MSLNIQKWHELTAQEILEFHTQIKENKVFKLNWNNPGRIDPDEYEKQFHQQVIENDEIKQVITTKTDENNRFTDTQLNARFDVCQDFENENEKEDFNELFKLRTMQNKSNRTTEKEIACMDKIFSDMRRNYQQQLQQEQEEEIELNVNKMEQTENS